MRGLLGGERQQVDRLVALQPGLRRRAGWPAGSPRSAGRARRCRASATRGSWRRRSSPSSEAATAMRASGVRSSWLQLASSRRWAATSSSMRWAERLKLAASAATSSRPSTLTRAPRSPPPSCSTPSFSRSSRRPRPRTTGIGADRDGEREQREDAVIQKIGLGRSRTWRATSQRPSGSCRVKFGPPGPRRQPVRARRGSKRGGGLPAMAIRRRRADRARGRSAACDAAPRSPSAARRPAHRHRAAGRR